ncbi:MAG: hypothetical protein ABIR68_19350 [Ilumatobacteraceae bacterium]
MTQQTTARRGPRWATRLAVATLALTGVALVTGVGESSAHTPTVNATCEGLSMSFSQYEGPEGNNVLTVVIDGGTTVTTFANDYATVIPWDDSQPHVWTVDLDGNIAVAGDKTYDFTMGGTQVACTESTTSSTSTTSPPTTTSADATTTTTTSPGTDATTTTTPTTPTTTTPTTTTPTTTTTIPATTTTVVAVAVPVPTTAAPTTTPASGGSQPVVAVEPPLAAPTGSRLPVTGTNTRMQLGVALIVLSVGLALMSAARRRPTLSPAAVSDERN